MNYNFSPHVDISASSRLIIYSIFVVCDAAIYCDLHSNNSVILINPTSDTIYHVLVTRHRFGIGNWIY
jgi:hypothetical protein